MPEIKPGVPAEPAGTAITRFNALRHGVLSRYTVLPWEDADEYRALVAALVAEHAAGRANRGASGRGTGRHPVAKASTSARRGRRLPARAGGDTGALPRDGEDQQQPQQNGLQTPGPQSSLLDQIGSFFISPAAASDWIIVAQDQTRSDETVITLKPAEGVEWKMTMTTGAQVRYSWRVEGGVVNYDMHATPSGGGKESSYQAARGVPGDEGVLTAGFDGTHGWFFRNRGSQPVTIILQTSGAYTDIRQVM